RPSRGWLRLHLRAPRAKQQPQQRQGKPRDALRAKCGRGAEGRRWKKREQRETGPYPDPSRANNSEREKPCGVKKWNCVVNGDGAIGSHRARQFETERSRFHSYCTSEAQALVAFSLRK